MWSSHVMIRRFVEGFRSRWLDFRTDVLLRQVDRMFTDGTLVKAREELLEWRRQVGVDSYGHALQPPVCTCGEELQLWPRRDTGIWCDSMITKHIYEDEGPTMHDVYSLEGRKLQEGWCGGL